MRITDNKALQAQCTVETIEWLHQAWELSEKGHPVQPDPFYARSEKLTPEIVHMVLKTIEDLFITEFKKYPGYHNNAQSIAKGEKLVPPGFDALPYPEQFAIVQGIDKIYQKYRPSEEHVLLDPS